MVNRGRIPYEYRDSRMHWTPTAVEQTIEGVLFYDEGEDKANKASKASSLATNQFSEIRINLEDLVAKTDLANKNFACKVYLKTV